MVTLTQDPNDEEFEIECVLGRRPSLFIGNSKYDYLLKWKGKDL
jgi:hypothetical protein